MRKGGASYLQSVEINSTFSLVEEKGPSTNNSRYQLTFKRKFFEKAMVPPLKEELKKMVFLEGEGGKQAYFEKGLRARDQKRTRCCGKGPSILQKKRRPLFLEGGKGDDGKIILNMGEGS